MITVKKIEGKYRLYESTTGEIARRSDGTPQDGGGFKDNLTARARSKELNKSLTVRR